MDWPDRNAGREEWLCRLLDLPVAIDRAPPQGKYAWHRSTSTRQRAAWPRVPPWDECVCLRWTGRQPWARETAAFQAELHEQVWRLADELLERDLLTQREAAEVAPALRLTVRDERGLKRPPLPDIEALVPQNPFRADRRGAQGPRRPRRRLHGR